MSENIRAALIIQNSEDPDDLVYVQILDIEPMDSDNSYIFRTDTPLYMIDQLSQPNKDK